MKELIITKIEIEIRTAEVLHQCKLSKESINQLEDICISISDVTNCKWFSIVILKQQSDEGWFTIPLIAHCYFDNVKLEFNLVGVKNENISK